VLQAELRMAGLRLMQCSMNFACDDAPQYCRLAVSFGRTLAMLRQAQHLLKVDTHGKGLVEITKEVAAWVADTGIAAGLLTVFCRHTSASLLIQENADPDVLTDLAAYFEHAVPEDGPYAHRSEGPDDMPSHIRTALTQTHLAIPVTSSKMALGAWQGIFLFEHRRGRRRREVMLHLIGE
jgi:secondary thiamine-phosphate synthase enzyme